MDRPFSFVPKVGLPYPVGTKVAGRIIAKLSDRLFKIELSGKFYTAELASRDRDPFAPGDRVYVRVKSKSGAKAFLEIVEPDFPNIESPDADDISRLARSAGWPADDAAHALVAALVARRMPLRSDMAEEVYRNLKTCDHPTPKDAEGLLIDFLRRKD